MEIKIPPAAMQHQGALKHARMVDAQGLAIQFDMPLLISVVESCAKPLYPRQPLARLGGDIAHGEVGRLKRLPLEGKIEFAQLARRLQLMDERALLLLHARQQYQQGMDLRQL